MSDGPGPVLAVRAVRATYRLAAIGDLDEVASRLPQLADLGVSHLHLPPVTVARPGSADRTDVVDHTRVDPALGGEGGLGHLADAAHAVGLGLVADWVPGHVWTGPATSRWDAVLAEGRSSESAKAVDVEWDAPLPGARDKVILGVLAGPYGDELVAGRLGLAEVDGAIRVTYGERSFPLTTESSGAVARAGITRLLGTPGEPRSWSRMHSLLEQQHYRLVSWRAGRRLVNYRRHLNHDELAALRVEEPPVFDATHDLLGRLVGDGLLDGACVRGVDGLADPAGYLARLRELLGPDAWVVVDRIDARRPLPVGWPVQGGAGHELVPLAIGVHIDPAGRRQLEALAAQHDALPDDDAVRTGTHEVLEAHLGTDLRRVARVVWRACQDDIGVRDVDYRTLLDAVARLVTSLPVARTYVDPASGSCGDADRSAVAAAVRLARAQGGEDTPEPVWRFLRELLSGELRWTAAAGEAVMRVQQLSAAVAALAAGEWLLAVHQAVPAVCEVGCDPTLPTVDRAAAHRELAALPVRGLRATATPSTLHGEDARLRLAALSGMAGEWTATAAELLATTDPPDPVLGLRVLADATAAWPIGDDGAGPLGDVLGGDGVPLAALTDHAVRLARTQGRITAHAAPDGPAERAVIAWVRGLLDPDGHVAPLLRPLAVRAAEVAMATSLGQVLLRCAAGGVPATLAGTEGWDVQLGPPRVGPPGAGPTAPVAELWAARRDGRIKRHVLATALRALRDHPEVLGPDAGYEPVPTTGRWADELLVWRRTAPGGAGQAIVVVPRLLGRVTDGGRFSPLGRIWADTEVVLSGDGRGGRGGRGVAGGVADQPVWHDLLTGDTLGPTASAEAADLLGTLPVALLIAR